MRIRDAVRILQQAGELPRRKRRWQPTARWRAAMAGNLSRAPRRRSADETWRIKQAVRDWLALPPERRPTQQDLARSFGVSKAYINRLVHRLPPSDAPAHIAADHHEPSPAPVAATRTERQGPSVIPAHIAAREAFLRSPAPSRSEAAQPSAAPVGCNQGPSAVKRLADAHDAALLAHVGYNPNRSKGWF